MTLILDEVELCRPQADQELLVKAVENLREQADSNDGVRAVLGPIFNSVPDLRRETLFTLGRMNVYAY